MPSLDEAYDRPLTGLRNPRRVGAGLALVAAGVLAIVASMVLVGRGGDSTTANLYAGLAVGAGIPAMLLGIVVVLPASRRNRLGVLFGTALTGVGIALYWFAYPERWTRTADPLAFETLAIYAAGCALALWFVFSALATFRVRNNPPGTISLEVIRRGETRTIEVSRDRYRELVGDGGDAEQVIRELDGRE